MTTILPHPQHVFMTDFVILPVSHPNPYHAYYQYKAMQFYPKDEMVKHSSDGHHLAHQSEQYILFVHILSHISLLHSL